MDIGSRIRTLLLPLLASLLSTNVLLHGQTVAAATTTEITIDAAYNAWGDPLRAVLVRPENAGPPVRVPACVIVHGSGGLFRGNGPGLACGPGIEGDYQVLAAQLAAQGVAVLLPSSFDSRDSRFCEDNDDDYFQFVAPPLFNAGDGPIVRDTAYDYRRTAVRLLDVLAATEYLCSLDFVDCNRTCLIGTSNGATTVLSYAAQDVARHFSEFVDTGVRRKHESSSAFDERSAALANLPALGADVRTRLQARPLPRFVQAISPGCGLRQLVPRVLPSDPTFDPGADLRDLYYPAARVHLQFEIGTDDSIPDECYGEGIRQVQATAYEALSGQGGSRYRVNTYAGAGHDLLDERGEQVHAELANLVQTHFFASIFADGYESMQSESQPQ